MGRPGKDVLSCVTRGAELGSGRFWGEVVRVSVTVLDAATRTDELVKNGAEMFLAGQLSKCQMSNCQSKVEAPDHLITGCPFGFVISGLIL